MAVTQPPAGPRHARERVRLGADRAGAPRRSAEAIGRHAARQLLAEIEGGACVDRYAADQGCGFRSSGRGPVTAENRTDDRACRDGNVAGRDVPWRIRPGREVLAHHRRSRPARGFPLALRCSVMSVSSTPRCRDGLSQLPHARTSSTVTGRINHPEISVTWLSVAAIRL